MKKLLSLLVVAVFVVSATGVAFSAPVQKRAKSDTAVEKRLLQNLLHLQFM